MEQVLRSFSVTLTLCLISFILYMQIEILKLKSRKQKKAPLTFYIFNQNIFWSYSLAGSVACVNTNTPLPRGIWKFNASVQITKYIDFQRGKTTVRGYRLGLLHTASIFNIGYIRNFSLMFVITADSKHRVQIHKIRDVYLMKQI